MLKKGQCILDYFGRVPTDLQKNDLIYAQRDEIHRLQSLIETKDALYDRVKRFMEENGFTCVETIHQCDWVIENAYEFMSDLYEIIKPELTIEEESN